MNLSAHDWLCKELRSTSQQFVTDGIVYLRYIPWNTKVSHCDTCTTAACNASLWTVEQWRDYSRILPSIVKTAKTKCVHFTSILNFIQNFGIPLPRRETRFHTKLSLFSNFKDRTHGGTFYSKNNPYRTLESEVPIHFPPTYRFRIRLKSNAVHKWLRDLRSIHEHFHTEHQHFCTPQKFIRTDNTI
jgi:hypothetical protein